MNLHSIGRETAIKLAESGWWIGKTPREICEVQLFTEELCCPIVVFHEALNKALGRGVYTHEMAGEENWQKLIDEFRGEREAPTLEEIINKFPPHIKVILA